VSCLLRLDNCVILASLLLSGCSKGEPFVPDLSVKDGDSCVAVAEQVKRQDQIEAICKDPSKVEFPFSEGFPACEAKASIEHAVECCTAAGARHVGWEVVAFNQVQPICR